VTTSSQTPQQDFASALKARDLHQINQSGKRLLELALPLGKTWKSVASVFQQNGEHTLAIEALEKWAEQSGRTPEILFEIASFNGRAGRHAQAEAALAEIPHANFDPVGIAYLRGTLATNSGQKDVAMGYLREAVTRDPSSGQSWLALAMLGHISDRDADALFAAAHHLVSANDLETAAYQYAKGRLLHQRSAYDEAFEAYSAGAAIMDRTHKFDWRASAQRASNALDGWTPQTISQISQQVDTTSRARPIFVTGLPRSGTTLCEQILVSHSEVEDGAELGLFRLLQQVIGEPTFHSLSAYLDKGNSADDLRSYYNHLLSERFPGTGLIVDKTVLASRYLGLIASLFPEAPIFWLRRDHLDNAWSAFSTFFIRGIPFSWNLTSLGQFMRTEDRLLAAWQERLGDRLRIVDYTALVSSSEQEIPALVSHANLHFEEQQAKPHLAERQVSTASVMQVREPINTKGLGSSKPYHKHLRPFIEAYERGPAD
tara:strand:- start:736 stop:2196 length:1461 start_codon:yes stop_codon:yes gene_type:complete